METLTPEEVEAFVRNGQTAITTVAMGAEQMKKWSDSFEQRGGAPVYGDDALELVYFNNELQAWLTPERRATISKFRLDV